MTAARVAVFVTDDLPPTALEALGGFEVLQSKADDGFLRRCQGLICWPHRVERGLLEKMPNLRMVQSMSAGVDRLDFGALPSGARVYSNAGAYTEAVAEHAWGILLGVAKGVHLRNTSVKPRKLRGKTLLVLGAGSIGSEVARMSKPLGMRVVGVSRSFADPGAFDEMLPLSSLPDKVGEADAVVMALPLTKSTRGLVDHALLARCKDSVVIANVGRGECVSEGGLVRWLKERPDSRYVTDVFWTEGGKEKFTTGAWDLPNFAGTLHISSLPLGEDLAGAKVTAAENVKRFFATGEARNLVDPSEYST